MIIAVQGFEFELREGETVSVTECEFGLDFKVQAKINGKTVSNGFTVAGDAQRDQGMATYLRIVMDEDVERFA